MGHLFKGLLAFFLLDMGYRLRAICTDCAPSPWLIAYGPVPLAHALLVFCRLLGLPAGDTILLMVLAASASYIAVPVLRYYSGGQPSSCTWGWRWIDVSRSTSLWEPLHTAWIQRLAFEGIRDRAAGKYGFFMWKFSS